MMTAFFSYADLTWPEVADLPRDTPLVIPLGHGYSFDLLATVLGNPARIGLLPPFPFGWVGSGLQVHEPLLKAYLTNLLQSLREDGFLRPYILVHQGIDLGLEESTLFLPNQGDHPAEVRFTSVNESRSGIPPEGETGKVILIPIGHTEQHGYHLPLSTDTLIIEAIAQATAIAAPDQATVLPVMPYGVSMHRSAFAGTLSAGGRAFEDFWLGIIDALVARGFDRFYLLSGHGGNCSFLVNIVKYAGERYNHIFCATSFLYLSGPLGVDALEKHRRSGLGGMGHACELETALILHLYPDLVHMEHAVDEIDFVATPAYYMDWIEGGALVANPHWYDDTATGAYGAGSLATAENGKIWFHAAVDEKVTHVAEIHEQHTRRETRRKQGYGGWGAQIQSHKDSSR